MRQWRLSRKVYGKMLVSKMLATFKINGPRNIPGAIFVPMIGSACGIRTRDLRLERAVSWASRRTRHTSSLWLTQDPSDHRIRGHLGL